MCGAKNYDLANLCMISRFGPREHSTRRRQDGAWLLHEGISCVPQIPVISIIDDDPSVRAATHRLVRSVGFTARTFASAADFLQSPHVNDTACVIADVQMPGMSGVELQSILGSFVP